jgi:hypothetical protein
VRLEELKGMNESYETLHHPLSKSEAGLIMAKLKGLRNHFPASIPDLNRSFDHSASLEKTEEYITLESEESLDMSH